MRDGWRVLVEEGDKVMMDFSKLKKYFINADGLKREIMPVVVQDAITKEVLLLAYVNEHSWYLV